MPLPILSTKLYIPTARSNLVVRPRLIARLDEGLEPGKRLTLISAPAGFGKTTLVSGWAGACGHAAGWLSLDEADSELARFLTYLIAALQAIAPALRSGMDEALQSSERPAVEAFLTGLVNELAVYPDPFVLVLDDYHVIDAHEIDEALGFLLEHLPPQMHLVITTREDPQLPLTRLRARGQLTEVRAADLRFRAAEAAQFLNGIMGLALENEEIAALERRTEGWIAALQLAALSMRGRDDMAAFIKAFAGDHRYIVDYLVQEVLERQPQAVRHFLLQTSILERLSGPLCDAVVGTEIGDWGLASTPENADRRLAAQTLAGLERGNLFVTALDDRQQWYRYHPLFAEVLQTRLAEEHPELVPALHARASDWYEGNGSRAEAVRHALAAMDVERAASLVELAWREMDRSHSYRRWLSWVEKLPDAFIRRRPVLCVAYAWALLDAGEFEAAEARLRDGERWLEIVLADGEQVENYPVGAFPAEMVVVDEDEFRRLPSTIATAHTYLAQALGDVRGSIRHVQSTLDLLPEEDELGRGVAESLLGLALWTNGDLQEAHRSFASAMARFEKVGNLVYAITGTYILADISLAQGSLREAVRTYERSIRLVKDHGESAPRGTAELYLGLSELLREQGDVEGAAQNRKRSEALSERASLPRWHYHSCLAQARVRQAEGDLNGALELLDEAEQHYIPGPVPDIRPIAALKARIWVAQGQLDKADTWAREQGVAAAEDGNYLHEFEAITLARVLLARFEQEGDAGALQEALSLIERLLQAAEIAGRTGSVLDLLIVRALAFEARGERVAALEALERALTIAETEGYVRKFVDEGAPMARLLSAAAEQGLAPDYTTRLLAACEQEGLASARTPLAPSSNPQPLVEPLSEREFEVLQLVAEGLTNRQIGKRLFIALDTVKGHNRRIFGKLQVRRRTEAVARARELGLL